MTNKIILTDYPKLKGITANVRGMETERLVEIHKELFHTMMTATTETAGGYAVHIEYLDVGKELAYRKAIPEGYDSPSFHEEKK